MIQKISSHKILRYALIGALSTLIHIMMAFLTIYYVNDSVFISNSVGFLCAFGFSYWLQSVLVFKHPLSVHKALKYFVVQFAALLLSMGVSYLAPLDNTYLKVLLVVIILPLCTYAIHHLWTFSKP
ncbi:MAG TPA: GtrA family protein [Sulfurovum sp.]|jgi:putative flippase GtrA|nr:MAG: hypothetical protein B7Y63_03910 [Sulfurovum sp. 35-42-20]OYZ25525.1 MAG: hypothetical protein B7Y23_05070 [Sulfurovum sp. 16-42-52]OYZ48180.1 MAG: hypothetical protein B7Y13_08475 [Sulfurovum sp. 24-42-9]OZA45644.1 MAG: hypothetical protein B7X80_04515 [Sulfurovum sp. 17-42-90]OZA59380.1 MAG: hypothetical protein B7X69_08315 [Sulfurovum sp. 39-42-12]HQR74034.1 GtrA family protein [Sulfurovum sp.]